MIEHSNIVCYMANQPHSRKNSSHPDNFLGPGYNGFGCSVAFSDRIMRGRSPAALNFINKACRKKVKPIKINNDKPISSNLNTGTWQIYRIIRAPIDKQQKYWLTSTSTSFVLSNSGLLAQHCGLRKRLQVTNMCVGYPVSILVLVITI